jgi:signal peptidase
MAIRRTLVRSGELIAVVAVFAPLFGQFLGQPVLLAFVETGSMSPTMEPGDARDKVGSQ